MCRWRFQATQAAAGDSLWVEQTAGGATTPTRTISPLSSWQGTLAADHSRNACMTHTPAACAANWEIYDSAWSRPNATLLY